MKTTQLDNSFVDDLTQTLTYESYDKMSNIHPSRGMGCLRKMCYQMIGIKGNKVRTTAASRIYMESGNALHKLIQRSMKHYTSPFKMLFSEYRLPKITLDENDPTYPVLQLSGIVDGIILWKEHLYVLEIKTCKEPPKSIKSEHMQQVQIYSAVIGLPVIVAYVSREPLEYSSEQLPLNSTWFVYEYSETKALEMFEKMYLVDTYVRNKHLYAKFDKPKGICNGCAFWDFCYGNKTNAVSALEVDGFEETLHLTTAQEYAKIAVDRMPKRRNGVISFIRKYGVNSEVLKGDWTKYL